jgi:hypothetical protein
MTSHDEAIDSHSLMCQLIRTNVCATVMLAFFELHFDSCCATYQILERGKTKLPYNLHFTTTIIYYILSFISGAENDLKRTDIVFST